ncbi:hypothetical protein [Flavobacterium sp. CS20]|uniref:hypothetical protein n=1 Tax=Flavobacterium sp. CS20 TaxID=2775246 RepID=UPI001FFC83EF|nr:hypothetical protein [Flavobacterium sp. CS20]
MIIFGFEINHMKFFSNLFFILIIIQISTLSAQNNYGINFPSHNRDQVCSSFVQIFKQKPREVKFSVIREGQKLYFQINDKRWFNTLFSNREDGIAIDVVSKKRYDCDIDYIKDLQIKGELLPPVYSKDLRRGLESYDDKFYRTFVGNVPRNLMDESLEYNILFLNNNNLCRYQIIYNLESYPWELLDMGMYLDSLTYTRKAINSRGKEGYVLKNKTLKFIIPFEKNKAEYTQKDIKPIYDSLRLTDFNIKTINIKAYSSVEGSLEHNIELQQQRANSIVEALQSFQKPTIQTNVSTSENWVEFLNDIKGTKHSDLAKLSKNQIKTKLVGSLSNDLEPILKHHRKAVVELELEKKDKYKNMTHKELLSKFNSAISNSNLEEAKTIQNSIFEKLKDKTISPDFLTQMQVPKQAKYVKILNKNATFKSMLDVRQSLIVYNELKALEKLVPNTPEVKYNIVATKIKLWQFKAIDVNPTKFKSQIKALKNYGISEPLISRMLVNFHIIKAENDMQKRDYASKNASVNFINNNYKKFDLSDYDYLSLAQFFSFYANTDLAVELLETKSRSIDIDEDLLFYYLNLTIIDKNLTENANYRTVLLNAFNMNSERFCKLFNSIENGGVTFQLLSDEYLRTTYCESCEQ